MLLSDSRIRRLAMQGLVEPYDLAMVQPASLEVTLGGDHVIAWKRPEIGSGEEKAVQVERQFPYRLQPFRPVVLATTAETLTIPTNLAGQFNGKSSLARLGILTHVTAGFLDPGFSGQITVELVNLGANPFLLEPGMKIGQVHFYEVSGRVLRPYGQAGNHYQGQVGPTVAEETSFRGWTQ